MTKLVNRTFQMTLEQTTERINSHKDKCLSEPLTNTAVLTAEMWYMGLSGTSQIK